jgi:hypothetical protein
MSIDLSRWAVGTVHGHITILAVEQPERGGRIYTIQHDCCQKVTHIAHSGLYDLVHNKDTRCKECRKATRKTVQLPPPPPPPPPRLSPDQILAKACRELRKFPPEKYAPVIAWPRPSLFKNHPVQIWGAQP